MVLSLLFVIMVTMSAYPRIVLLAVYALDALGTMIYTRASPLLEQREPITTHIAQPPFSSSYPMRILVVFTVVASFMACYFGLCYYILVEDEDFDDFGNGFTQQVESDEVDRADAETRNNSLEVEGSEGSGASSLSVSVSTTNHSCI